MTRNTRMRPAWVLFAVGLLGAAGSACADDFTVSVPQADVVIAAGGFADVPITITNTTDATSAEFDIRLPPPVAVALVTPLVYHYEIRSPDICGPLMPEGNGTAVVHARVPPIAAGASATCVVRVTRDSAEVNSGSVIIDVSRVGLDGLADIELRVGTFADIDFDLVQLSRSVSGAGIHTVLRATAHNRSPMALAQVVVTIDPWFSGRAVQQVVAGSCELLFGDGGLSNGPGDFLAFAAIPADATAQCDIDSVQALSDDYYLDARLQVARVMDGTTGGAVHPSMGLPPTVSLPLHFAEVALNQVGVSGSWANAATPAQGVVLNIAPDFYGPGHAFLFGGWFTYGDVASAGPRWYTIQGNVEGTAESFDPALSSTSDIYLSTGGLFGSAQPATTQPVGDVRLRFADCNHGQMIYRFDVEKIIPITRVMPNATCTPDGHSDVQVGADYNLVGTWADPSHSAQGLVIDVDPTQHVLFAGWFTYPRSFIAADTQRWYTLQGLLEPNAPRGSGITIYQSSGGVFDGSAPATTVPVGDVDITMHTCTSATLTYRFNDGENAGLNGTLELQRLGNPPGGCSM